MGKLVVIIDGSLTVRKIVETCLHREGYEVWSFSDGEAVLRWLGSVNKEDIRRDRTEASQDHSSSRPSVRIPDLFIIDLILPKMDGYSIIGHLRAQPTFRHVPIVILSRKDGMLDQLRGRLAGASDYIVKPFTVHHLVTVVQCHIGNASMTELVPV